MSTHKLWLLKLVPPFRYGRLLTGVVLFSLLLPFFYLGIEDDPEHNTPALFFSLVLAYIIPVFSHITAKSQEALLELRPLLNLDDPAFEQTQRRLDSTSWGMVARDIGGGALLGVIHMSFVRGSVAATITEMMASVTGFMSTLGALLVWIIMTSVIANLIRQSVQFSRLGANEVRVSLFNVHQLAPFARVSISSSLAIIGALALFPLIGLEGGMYVMEILPGAIATLVPLVIIFILPVWPLHRRLARLKAQQMASVNERIGTCLDHGSGDDSNAETLERLLPLLGYRREIDDAHTWPFDIGNVSRLSLYLVIPPLTWVAAALMENLVDSLL